jgi:predicted lipoprotein with Yx(FWY)xxD motif
MEAPSQGRLTALRCAQQLADLSAAQRDVQEVDDSLKHRKDTRSQWKKRLLKRFFYSLSQVFEDNLSEEGWKEYDKEEDEEYVYMNVSSP